MEVIDSEQPLVSVVVPIYKVEKYLRQCVDSILSQTLRKIEVILVDDGSPDTCPAIVDEYAKADSRVVALHQPNGGYGKAVNNGIARATGKYIGIIESDDWIEPNMYEVLVTKAEETGAEVVKGRFWYYNSKVKDESEQNKLYKNLSLPHIPCGESFRPLEHPEIFLYHSSLWSNLYLADFIKPIKVIESAKAAYQDFPFIMEVLARVQNFVFIDMPLVHYRMEEGQGSSCTRNDKRLIQSPIIKLEAILRLERLGVMKDVCEEVFYHVFKANQKYLARIQMKFAQEFYERFQELMKKVVDYPHLQYKYFSEHDRRYLKKMLARESVNSVRRRWRLSISRKRFSVILNGESYSYTFPWGR